MEWNGMKGEIEKLTLLSALARQKQKLWRDMIFYGYRYHQKWVKLHKLLYRIEYSLAVGRTVLQYCCCLFAILTAWKKFMKIINRKGGTRVKNNSWRHVLPACHQITTFSLCTYFFLPMSHADMPMSCKISVPWAWTNWHPWSVTCVVIVIFQLHCRRFMGFLIPSHIMAIAIKISFSL